MATINLSWTPAGGATSTSQKVQRKLASGSTWTDIATGLSTTANSYSDTTAVANTLYDYQVVNICSVGGPSASGTVQADSITCPSLTASNPQSGTYDTIVVNYGATSADVSHVSLVLLDAAGSALVATAAPAPSGQGAGTYTFTGLDYDTTYTIRLTVGDGTFTKECEITQAVGSEPACGAPTNVTATPA
jgi:hypothetical protein